MPTRSRSPSVPREVIRLTAYSQLELYLSKSARGELGLVLLRGRHGTGKSESVRRSLCGSSDANVLYVEGHMQPFGLYRQLWEYRNQPVVLDDLDRLYADPDCVRLLKPLCNTVRVKSLHWLTNLTMNDGTVPSSFSTCSSVILIANEWKGLNANVRALEDRAIILHFCPSNDEVHLKVREWFDDPEVYEFLGKLVPLIPAVHAALPQGVAVAPRGSGRLAREPAPDGDPRHPDGVRAGGTPRPDAKIGRGAGRAVHRDNRGIESHILPNEGQDHGNTGMQTEIGACSNHVTCCVKRSSMRRKALRKGETRAFIVHSATAGLSNGQRT